ncbi:hypothetical protein PFISCL1PPCAC_27659, partial [Pristionchus fissidentatus]
DRRLLLLLLVVDTISSSFLDGKKVDDVNGGTCSTEKKQCGGGEKKAKKKEPFDISVMWSEKPESNEHHSFDKEGQYDGRVAQAVIKKLGEKPRVLDTKCSEITGICYEVVDRIWYDNEGFGNNPWEMLRQVQVKGEPEAHFGRATLVKPKELNWKTYDTKNWAINDGAVIDRETQALIGGLTGSLAIPRKAVNATRNYYILLVGLGTPTITNFLKRYHWMEVLVLDNEPVFEYFARKWFGFRLGPNLNYLQADPISFMSWVVGEKVQYDAVIINECKDHADPHPCPASVYLERATMDVVRKVVRSKHGVFGVNTRSTEKKYEKEVANAYESVFPMCFDYPGEHKKLQFERYKSTICFNRPHRPFWQLSEKQYAYDAHHNFFYYV